MSYSNSHSIRSVMNKISKNGNDSSYFLLGDDYFLQSFFLSKIKENSNPGTNIDYYYLNDQSDLEMFFNSLSSMSLFTNENIFIIKNFNRLSSLSQNMLDKYLNNADKNNTLIFILDEFMIKNKFSQKISNFSTIVNTQTPVEESKIKKWIRYYFRNQKQQVDDDILDYFIKNYKSGISSIVNEVEKYYLNTSFNDVNMNHGDNNYFSKHIKVWNLLDALGKKKAKDSIIFYNNLYFNGLSLVPIIINLNNFFFELLCSYETSSKINYSMLNKTLQSRFNIYKMNYKQSEINEIFIQLRDSDILIKTSTTNENLLFTSLILKICGGYYYE
jgi:DNA polymerase III delta subunit